MNEQECLSKMYSPQDKRPGKKNFGVLQICVTSSCNLACYNCTQGSQLRRPISEMTPQQFEDACISLKGYFGTVGIFGGSPCISQHFPAYCKILREHFPQEQCGLWANNLFGHGRICRATFNPARSNLNVHLDRKAWDEFKRDWPESMPFGLNNDSRHSPVFVSMKDVLKKWCPDCDGGGLNGRPSHNRGPCEGCNGKQKVYDEDQAWDLISNCDINKHWSAMIGVFRGELRGWFCEIAGSQAMLNQHDPDYPDLGLVIDDFPLRINTGTHKSKIIQWWQQSMYPGFSYQVRFHCHRCSVPLRGHGELAQAENGTEQTSKEYEAVYKPKKKDRKVEIVENRDQLKEQPSKKVTVYLGVK